MGRPAVAPIRLRVQVLEMKEEEEGRPRSPGKAVEGAAQGAEAEFPLMRQVSVIQRGPQPWPWS